MDNLQNQSAKYVNGFTSTIETKFLPWNIQANNNKTTSHKFSCTNFSNHFLRKNNIKYEQIPQEIWL